MELRHTWRRFSCLLRARLASEASTKPASSANGGSRRAVGACASVCGAAAEPCACCSSASRKPPALVAGSCNTQTGRQKHRQLNVSNLATYWHGGVRGCQDNDSRPPGMDSGELGLA